MGHDVPELLIAGVTDARFFLGFFFFAVLIAFLVQSYGDFAASTFISFCLRRKKFFASATGSHGVSLEHGSDFLFGLCEVGLDFGGGSFELSTVR